MGSYLHSQQRNTTCAVAAIRSVLHRQFGVRVAEAALVALGTTPHEPIVRHGAATNDMRRIVRGASRAFNHGPPWTLRVRRQGTLRQLKYWVDQGRWPIVQVFVEETIEYHAVIVLEVEPDRVKLFDPDPTVGKKPRWMSKEQFLAWWKCPVSGERWWSVINGGDLVRYE